MRYLLTLLALSALALQAQNQTAGYEDPRNLPHSPEVHPDLRVTLRMYAPNAKEVVLMGPTIVSAVGGPKKLTKDEKGVWSITVGPLKPAVYSYGFSIDGAMRIADPANPEVETRRWGHTSYVAVQGQSPEVWSYRNVPHGSLHTHSYDSKSLGMPRRFVVYTPPGYEKNQSRYPVLYLLHGSTQIEESWSRVGAANYIMDNLQADGKAVPMIVVMPYGHVPRQMVPQSTGSAGGPAGGPGAGPGGANAGIEKDILSDVLPEVERLYRVQPGKANRAIAGLSMGGGQAMLIGARNPQLFSYMASFSGAPGYRAELEKADPKVLNKEYRLIWIGCGTEDSLFKPNKAAAELLDTKGVKHVWRETPGAHVWPVWHQYLSEVAPLLFQKAKT